MKKLVIFDMDGVLIDSEMYCYQGYHELLQNLFKVDMTLAEYGVLFAGKNPMGALDQVNQHFGINLKEQDIMNYFQSKADVKVIHPIKSGAKELVEYCHQQGIKMIIASSSGKERIYEQIAAGGILDYFDDVVSGREVNRGKPYPDIFLKACEKMNVEPKDAVVLEDSEAGLKAAQSGNIDAIWIPDIAKPKAEVVQKCAAVLPSLKEVIDYLGGENHE